MIPLIAAITAYHETAVTRPTAKTVPDTFVFDGIGKACLLGKGEWNVLRLDKESLEIILVVRRRFARNGTKRASGALLPLLCSVEDGLDHSNALFFG